MTSREDAVCSHQHQVTSSSNCQLSNQSWKITRLTGIQKIQCTYIIDLVTCFILFTFLVLSEKKLCCRCCTEGSKVDSQTKGGPAVQVRVHLQFNMQSLQGDCSSQCTCYYQQQHFYYIQLQDDVFYLFSTSFYRTDL